MPNNQQIETLAPPRSFFGKLKFLGPGFILSASIVGSGELIATTILGAKGGFITFWVILVSCFIKVAIQLEFGKNSIISGNSLMKDFNSFPGMRIGKSHWTVLAIFLLTTLKILQLGGMIGGAALTLNLIFPKLPIEVAIILLGLSLPVFFIKNYYRTIEKAATWMVFAFTLFTLASFIGVFFTPFSFGWIDLASGLTFSLPRELLFVAIGAFGITGVASDEIIAYSYWCQEKGYGKYVGPYEDTPDWHFRAKGWIKVMHLDALVSMVIYTLLTSAFYLLGAAILHHNEVIPEGTELINTLASIYTESLGSGAKVGYLIGAFFALYSSVFATLANWTRLLPDIFIQNLWINPSNLPIAVKSLVIGLPICWVITFLFLRQPAFLVLIGGVVGSILLLIIVQAAIIFYKRHKLLQLTPSLFYQVVFWMSIFTILAISIYGILKIV